MPHGNRNEPGDRLERTDDAQERVAVLYRDQAAAIRRRLSARLGSADEANELLHDAFARLLGAGRTQELRNPGAFLNRIVRNLLIDRSRRRSTRPVHVDLHDQSALAVAADQADAIELEQVHRRYEEIVNSLPPRMREVFVLHRQEGLGYKQIAERLGISVRTVEWHIAEAIVRIARGLDCG